MFVRILIAGMCLVGVVGCKRAKNTAPARDDSTSAKAQPTPAPNDKNKKPGKDEPNWLTDPRFNKDQPKFDPNQTPGGAPEPKVTPGGATGKEPWKLGAPQGGWQGGAPGVQPNPVPGPGGPLPGGPNSALPPLGPGANPPPGGGVLQPNPVPGNPPPLAPGAGTPIGAAKKAVVLADMRDIQVFVHDASIASNKMPAPAEIYAALVKAGSPAAEHVKSGAIILTGATDRDSVWAYEAQARLSGGMAVSQNGVETLTAAELQQRLGK
jgi:hypothetical protein